MAEAEKILGQLQSTFEQFKAEHDKELADIKAGMGDVVQSEKVDRINDEVTRLTKELDALQMQAAAGKLGGGSGGPLDQAKAEHRDAFGKFVRKGLDAGLRDLEVKAALTTQSDPDGGYLVPEELESGIDRILGTQSAMRQLARKVTIGAQTYRKIVSMGGAGSGWVGEEQARPETATPTLREIAVNAKELYANPAATQTMLDDSFFNIEQFLAEEVAIEFAEKEGAAFITGNGVNQPRGILSYDVVANASYEWGKIGSVKTGAASDFATPTASVNPADCLIDAVFALKPGYRANAAWVMNDTTMAKIRKFKDKDGYLVWAPPTAVVEVPTILGKPVYSDDNMPAISGGNNIIAIGDFNRAYLIVDRAGIAVLRDPYTNKPFVHFYTTKRVGGGVVNFEALKLVQVGN